jgi:hypothetical protein
MHICNTNKEKRPLEKVITHTDDINKILSNELVIYHYFKSKEEYESIENETGRGDYYSNIALARKLLRTKFEQNHNVSYPGLYFSFRPKDFLSYGPYLLVLTLKPIRNWQNGYPDNSFSTNALLLAEDQQLDFAKSSSDSAGVLLNFDLIKSFDVIDSNDNEAMNKMASNEGKEKNFLTQIYYTGFPYITPQIEESVIMDFLYMVTLSNQQNFTPVTWEHLISIKRNFIHELNRRSKDSPFGNSWYPPLTLTEYCNTFLKGHGFGNINGIDPYLKTKLDLACDIKIEESEKNHITQIQHEMVIFHPFNSSEDYRDIINFKGRQGYNTNKALAVKLFRAKLFDDTYGTYFNLTGTPGYGSSRYFLAMKLKPGFNYIKQPIKSYFSADKTNIDLYFDHSNQTGILYNYTAIESFEIFDRTNLEDLFALTQMQKKQSCSFNHASLLTENFTDGPYYAIRSIRYNCDVQSLQTLLWDINHALETTSSNNSSLATFKISLEELIRN